MRAAVREPVWAVAAALARPTASQRVLPDYVIVGAQRCGTTSLQGVLTQHPNLTSPRLMKGVHYYDTAYEHDLDWYRSHFHTETYARWKDRRTGSPLLAGEASPYYLFHPLALDRIKQTLPGVKVIALLRDPVERTISHHKHEVRRFGETLSLEEALDWEPERIEGEEDMLIRGGAGATSYAHQHYSYVARSRYAGQVRRMLDLFGDDALVLESEAFFADPATQYRHILRFLGVPEWAPSAFPHSNATEDAAVPDHLRKRLQDEFRDGNEELYDLLGRRFSWQ